MKIFSALVMTLISSIAMAHPTDDLEVTQIGLGSALVVKRDINIIPNVKFNNLGIIGSLGKSCNIEVEPSPIDRVLKAGTNIIITSILKRASGFVYSFKLMNTNNQAARFEVTCFSYKRSPADRVTTIGHFRNMLANKMDLQLATPVEL